MIFKAEDRLDEIDKLISLDQAAKQAVLYRKYLTDKYALEKRFKKREKAIKTARSLINYAFALTNAFKRTNAKTH